MATQQTYHSPLTVERTPRSVRDSFAYRRAMREHGELITQYPGLAWTHEPFVNHEWFLVEFKKDVKTKLGVAFRKGDWAIAYERPADYASNGALALPAGVSAWSSLNRIETAVRPASFTRIK